MRISLFVLLTLGMLLVCAFAVADEIVVEFTAGDYTITDIETGEIINMDGFGTSAEPGAPMLPWKVYDVALPPDTVRDSVSIRAVDRCQADVSGLHDIAPGPPAVDLQTGKQLWGRATNIVDGKDTDVYSRDAFEPTQTVELIRISQMRKWIFAQVAFRPMMHNPVKRRLELCETISVKIEFNRDGSLLHKGSLLDMVMDDRAAQKFINYRLAREWYKPSVYGPLADGETFDYVVITTEAIKAGSGEFNNLVTHLQNLGHSVLVLTESDSYGDAAPKAGGYGSESGDAPNGTADKIRKWLLHHYAEGTGYGIKRVLLIGDPDPDYGDLPMKKCYVQAGSNPVSAPTDHYFANVTSDWDTNDDEIFGEYGVDTTLDFTTEIYVGRIPFYSSYADLDGIIRKVIEYETASGDLNWRRSALLPVAFTSPGTEGSSYGRAIKTDLDAAGFSSYEMYERRGADCYDSITPDENLVDGAMVNHWKDHAYGMNWWHGHGDIDITTIGYDDDGGDCYYDEFIFDNYYGDDSALLTDNNPSFMFMASCLNGCPEASYNLGYVLLKKGAIATMSASRSSYGWAANFDTSWPEATCRGIGYQAAKRVIDYDNCDASKALYDAKEALTTSGYYGILWWTNKLIFNLYGCPQTRIYGTLNNYIRLQSFEAHARGSKIVLTWETGVEIDNAGFMIYRFDGTERNAISRLIPAQGSAAAGASYSFVDSGVRPGVTYVYWLVDIDTNGTWTSHGPVRARIGLEPAGVQIRKTTTEQLSGRAAIAR